MTLTPKFTSEALGVDEVKLGGDSYHAVFVERGVLDSGGGAAANAKRDV